MDDPGKKKLLYRRVTNYPESVMKHSNSSTTIMVCGSALVPFRPLISSTRVNIYGTCGLRMVPKKNHVAAHFAVHVGRDLTVLAMDGLIQSHSRIGLCRFFSLVQED